MEHGATFEVETQADSYATRRSMERLCDSPLEEPRTLREGTGDSTGLLAESEAIREAARNLHPGRSTVVSERRDDDYGG